MTEREFDRQAAYQQGHADGLHGLPANVDPWSYDLVACYSRGYLRGKQERKRP